MADISDQMDQVDVIFNILHERWCLEYETIYIKLLFEIWILILEVFLFLNFDLPVVKFSKRAMNTKELWWDEYASNEKHSLA